MASACPRSSAPSPGIRARRIHKSKNRPVKFCRNLHRAQRLAVALGIRHAEISIDVLLRVARFLMPDDQNFFAVKTRHAANDRGIVAQMPRSPWISLQSVKMRSM